MNRKFLPIIASIIFAVLTISFLIGFYTFAAWEGPTDNPPYGNVEVPLNVGKTPQWKEGKLGIATDGIDDKYGLTVGNALNALGIKVAGDSLFEGGTTTINELVVNNGITLGGERRTSWPEAAETYWKLSGSNLYTSSSSWNVGIGTTNPGAKLDVAGAQYYQSPTLGDYWINYYLGANADPNPGDIILLIPNPGGKVSGSFMEGILTASRGGVGAYGSLKQWFISVKRAYHERGGSIMPLSNEQAHIKLVTCDYKGQNYIAVDTTGIGASCHRWKFTGSWLNTINNQKPTLVARSSCSNIQDFVTYHSFGRQISIDSNGNVGIGTTGPSAKLQVRASGNNNPANNGLYVFNPDNAGGNDDAIITARVGGSSAGDPFISLDIKGEYGWTVGVDNSDGNKFKIDRGWADVGEYTDFVIDTGGKVGIGTGSPGAKLDVYGGVVRFDSSGAGDKIQFEPQGTFHRIAFNELRFWDWDTGGDMVVFNNGKVGIGTTNPSQKLDVSGNINYSGQLTKLDVANNFTATVRAADFKIGYSTRRGSPGRALVDLGGSLALNYAGDWGMTEIHGSKTYISGKVGIGTTNPTTKLDVAGYVKGRTGLCIGNDCRTSWPSGGGGGSGSLRCVTYYNTEDVEYGIWYSGSLNSPSCPAGYKATGCAGGLNGLDMDSLSWDIYDTYCRINFTVQGGGLANDVDSTVRCCKVQ